MATESHSLWHYSLAEFQKAVETRSTPGCGAAAAVGACFGLSLVLKGLRLTADKRQHPHQSQALISRGDALYRELAAAVDDDAAAFAEWLDAKRMEASTEAARQEKQARLDAAQQASIDVPLAAAGCCERVLALAGESVDETAPMLESDTVAGALMVKAGLEALLVGVEANVEGRNDGQNARQRCEQLRTQAGDHCRRLGLTP